MSKNYILLEGMRFYAYHGLLEEERLTGNHFLVDLKICLNLSKATQSDHIEDTINYVAVYSVVKDEMQVSSNLLEHVAGRIIQRIKSEFPGIKKVKIKLSKLNPPVGGEVLKVSVVL